MNQCIWKGARIPETDSVIGPDWQTLCIYGQVEWMCSAPVIQSRKTTSGIVDSMQNHSVWFLDFHGKAAYYKTNNQNWRWDMKGSASIIFCGVFLRIWLAGPVSCTQSFSSASHNKIQLDIKINCKKESNKNKRNQKC